MAFGRTQTVNTPCMFCNIPERGPGYVHVLLRACAHCTRRIGYHTLKAYAEEMDARDKYGNPKSNYERSRMRIAAVTKWRS